MYLEPGVLYGGRGKNANNAGGCPLGSCHTLDGAFPAFRGPRISVLPFVLIGLGEIYSGAPIDPMARVRQMGAEGEQAVGLTGPKMAVRIPGKGNLRYPDGLTATTITEVKNVGYQPLTSQLRDDIALAKATGRSVVLWVRPSTCALRTIAELFF